MRKLDIDIEEVDESAIEIIEKIISLAGKLGWYVAIPDLADDDIIDHILLGTGPALEEIDSVMDCYSIYKSEDTHEESIH